MPQNTFFFKEKIVKGCIISERSNQTTSWKKEIYMDNGASSYLRFLNGDNDSFVDLVKEYGDGLILFLNSI